MPHIVIYLMFMVVIVIIALTSKNKKLKVNYNNILETDVEKYKDLILSNETIASIKKNFKTSIFFSIIIFGIGFLLSLKIHPFFLAIVFFYSFSDTYIYKYKI